MSVLDTLDFQPMLITDLFQLHPGSGRAKSDVGPVPYVAASFQRNGVVGFAEEAKYPGGWLSFVKDGDGGAGTCFYQPSPFWPSNHVYALEPIGARPTAKALIVMASIITHQCFPKFNRGNAANAARLSRQHIMVPAVTNADGTLEADWKGMERLGTELLEDVLTHTRRARQTQLTNDDTLPELSFKPMLITDVFETYRQAPAWLNANQVTSGTPRHPHVSNTARSNSISSFIAHQEQAPNRGNAITVGIDTQVVAFQPVPFYGATKVFELRSPRLNANSALVLMAALRQAIAKFSWGHKASARRLEATRIMVPVVTNAEGEDVIDWDGISTYGRALRVRIEHRVDRALSSLSHVTASDHEAVAR